MPKIDQSDGMVPNSTSPLIGQQSSKSHSCLMKNIIFYLIKALGQLHVNVPLSIRHSKIMKYNF